MAAIQTTLELIRRKLNESLHTPDPRYEDWVILSSIVGNEGHPYEQAKNKVVMFVANIQHETGTRNVNQVKDHSAHVAPPLYIDLFVLFFANFSERDYTQGLMMISQTISFFQQNPWFTHENLPGLDPVIDKLTFEMVNLDLGDLHHLMDMAGANYLPSVYYKLRLIPFISDATSSEPAA